MSAATTRADFIKLTGLAGAGLALGMTLPAGLKPADAAAAASDLGPNAWLRVEPSGLVTVMVNKAEMGQGVATSLPMMVAEELDVPMSAIRTEFAPSEAKYGDPGWGGDMVTGGSTSVPNMYMILRKAGATARAMLVSAAATEWNVPADGLTTKDGMVLHADGKTTAKYGDLVTAAAALPVPTTVTLKKPDQFTLIGTAVKRTDLVAKTNGTAGYGIDVKRPGMLIASIERPPAIGGTVKHFDATAAKKVKGVRHVVAVSSGIAVVADNMWAAKQGRAALKATWDAGKTAQVSTASIDAMHVAALKKPGIVQGKPVGNIVAAMKNAHKTLEATYSAPYLAHATMEPMNATAHVTADKVEIWAPNQVPLHAQKAAAKITGLPESSVIVHSTFLGGGFGRRLEHDYVVDAVEVAKAVGKPVKVVWTREDDVMHDVYRSGGMNKLSGGIDANGNLVAMHHHATASSVTARWAPAFLVKGQDGYAVEGATPLVYAIPNFLMDWSPVDPGIPVGYWRAPGANVNTFATESFLDELAHAGGKDPVAFRRHLLASNPRALAVLDAAVAKAQWNRALPKGHAHGVAMITWAGSIAAVIAQVSMPTATTIKVHKLTMAADVGQPINTDGLQAQMQSAMLFGLSSALMGKITFKNGVAQQSNFDSYHVLRMADTPEIDTVIVKSTLPPTGAGELGTPPVPAAVANALFALSGKRLRSLPLGEALA